jgi:hypothetical protein
VVGLAMLPLQLIAWLGSGLLFEYLGLAALGAYARVLRESDKFARTEPVAAAPMQRGSVMGQIT